MKIKSKFLCCNMSTFFSTILLCVILLEGIFNTIIVSIVPVDNMLGFVLLGLCTFCLVRKKIKVEVSKIFVLLVVCCAFIISLTLGLTSIKLGYLIYFLSFGFAGMLCSCLELDVDKLLSFSTLMTIGVTILFIIKDWYIIGVDYFSFGYMMVPGILCITFYIFELVKRKSFILSVLLGVFDCYILSITLKNCGRGVYLCFFIFGLLVVALLNRYRWTKVICLFVVGVGTVILVYIEKIVYMIKNFLETQNIQIYAIDKCIRLIEKMGDITNGRIYFWKGALENLNVHQVLFGRGIGEYEIIYGDYPHNLVLSIFGDYGLLGVIGLTVIFFLLCRNIAHANYKERYIYILLISVCVSKLMLSSVYWKSSGFWLLLGLCLSKTRYENGKKYKKIYTNNEGVKC